MGEGEGLSLSLSLSSHSAVQSRGQRLSSLFRASLFPTLFCLCVRPPADRHSSSLHLLLIIFILLLQRRDSVQQTAGCLPQTETCFLDSDWPTDSKAPSGPKLDIPPMCLSPRLHSDWRPWWSTLCFETQSLPSVRLGSLFP